MPALIIIGCIVLFFVILFTVHINVRIAMKDDTRERILIFQLSDSF